MGAADGSTDNGVESMGPEPGIGGELARDLKRGDNVNKQTSSCKDVKDDTPSTYDGEELEDGGASDHEETGGGVEDRTSGGNVLLVGVGEEDDGNSGVDSGHDGSGALRDKQVNTPVERGEGRRCAKAVCYIGGNFL